MKVLASLATAAAAIVLAPHASANPIDTDNDGVFDWQDSCPNQRGSATNYGCPGEVVVVVGERDSVVSMTCPNQSTVSHWTECHGWVDWTRWHAVYTDQHTGAWLYTDTHTKETEEPEEPEEPNEEEAFAQVDCDASKTACWTPGDWAAFCGTLENAIDLPDWWPFDAEDVLPSQCSVRDVALDALEAKLAEIARDYPRTTCAVGVVSATGLSLTFAKMRAKRSNEMTWVVVSTTGIACAAVMDIYL